MDSKDVNIVFKYHWNKMFFNEMDCPPEMCKKFVTICVEELGTRSGAKTLDDHEYNLKFAKLKAGDKLKKAMIYGMVCELTGKGIKRAAKVKDYEPELSKKKPIHDRLYIKKSDVMTIREKRKEILDDSHPYKPKIKKKIPETTYKPDCDTLRNVIGYNVKKAEELD